MPKIPVLRGRGKEDREFKVIFCIASSRPGMHETLSGGEEEDEDNSGLCQVGSCS